MPQIEAIMLVALGFVLATLIAMFIGRGMWTLAIDASRRGEERDRPSELARVQADRDQLRAECAILSRKFELRLTDIKFRLAEQAANPNLAAEISRHRNRIEHLLEDIDARDAAVASANAAVEETTARLEPLEAELARRTQSLQMLEEQLGDRDKTIYGRHRELAGSHALSARRDRQIHALHATPADLESTSANEEAESASAYERLMAHGSSLTS